MDPACCTGVLIPLCSQPGIQHARTHIHNKGQLGQGDQHNHDVLVRLTAGLPGGEPGVVRGASCSDYHTVVAMASGEVCTFGNGEYGRLGHGDEEEFAVAACGGGAECTVAAARINLPSVVGVQSSYLKT